MSYDVPPDWLDRELVLEFFWKFSVFECALKRDGFLHSDWNNVAQPDWKKFGQLIQGRFGEVQSKDFPLAVRALKQASSHGTAK